MKRAGRGRKQRFGRGGDLQRLGHAADAGLVALRHLACVRTDQLHAVGPKLRQVPDRRLVRPHFRVHRGREQDRPVGREQHRRGQIVGVAVRHLGHQIGRRGRDDHDVGVACEPDMTDVELELRVEQVRVGRLARECAGRQRRDELLRRVGHDDAHRDAALAQPPDQVERFVGRDPAADDEQGFPRGAVGFFRGPCRSVGFRRGGERFPVRRRAAQDGADLVLHRTAVPRRAQAQPLLERFVELPDGQAGHRKIQ